MAEQSTDLSRASWNRWAPNRTHKQLKCNYICNIVSFIALFAYILSTYAANFYDIFHPSNTKWNDKSLNCYWNIFRHHRQVTDIIFLIEITLGKLTDNMEHNGFYRHTSTNKVKICKKFLRMANRSIYKLCKLGGSLNDSLIWNEL